MTSYKDALVLLNDLKKYADENSFPQAEKLLATARASIEKDRHGKFPPLRKPTKSNRPYLIQ